MVSSSVYSIRIDSRVRKMIDELHDQGLADEIRTLIEQAVKKKRKEQLLAQARKSHYSVATGASAAEMIREDRDGR